MSEGDQKKISYYVTNETECPVCKTKHNREEMLTGGGRLIAGKLTQELRRLYQENRKFGLIYPLAYAVQVCPGCFYAAYPKDFNKLSGDEAQAIKTTTPHRRDLLTTLFNTADFSKPRDLVLGAASYLLAVDCYHLRGATIAPTPKKAVSAMRAAWLLDDLFKLAPQRPYDKASDFYYMEAVSNYRLTLELMTSGKEPIEAEAGILGPDLDHNWMFDGVIYLNAYLTKKYLNQLADSDAKRYKILEQSKRYLAKLYGMGKSSKSKPSVIIDMARDLYDELGEMLKTLEATIQS